MYRYIAEAVISNPTLSNSKRLSKT